MTVFSTSYQQISKVVLKAIESKVCYCRKHYKAQPFLPLQSQENPSVPQIVTGSLLGFFFERFYLFTFRERGREGEREVEKHQCVVVSHVAPTGNLAHNPGMCPDGNGTGDPLVCSPRSIH